MKKKSNLRTYPGEPGVANGGDPVSPSTEILEDHSETVCSYLPDGTFIHVNEVFCRFFGINRQDIVGKKWTELVSKEDLAMIELRLREMSWENPVVVVENRVRSAEGIRWMQFVNRGRFDKKGRLLETRSVGRDITERVMAQQALEESNERWKFAIESSGDGVWDWDVANGTVAFSGRWKTMLGYAEAEIKDRFGEWESRVHPEDMPGALAALKAHFDGERETYAQEFRMRCKDGSWKWILARGKAIARDEEGKPLRVIGTHTDISGWKAVKDREARNLHMVAEGAPCRTVLEAIVNSVEAEHPSLIGCVMRLSPDGRALRVAAGPALPAEYRDAIDGLRVGPYSACCGSAVFHNRREIAVNIQQDPRWRALRKAAQEAGLHACWSEPIRGVSGGVLGTLTCYRRETGQPAWSEIGTVMNAAALAALALERERAEQAQRESEQRFRAIFEQAAVGVLLIDAESGQILGVNQRACEIARLPKRHVLGSTVSQLAHPNEYAEYKQLLKSLLLGKTRSFAIEERLRHDAGSPIWVNLTVSPLWRSGEIPGKYMAVMEDITARKEAEVNYQRELDYNRALITHTAAYIVALDKVGRFMHVNPAFLRGIGYSKQEVINRTPWEIGLMDEAMVGFSKRRFENLLLGSENPPMEMRLRTKSGDWLTVELRSTLTRKPDGSVDRIIVTGADLTERNRLQQEVLNVVEREQARLGHDLHDGVGQTMTGIVALIEVLELELKGSQREDAARIRQLIRDGVSEIRRMSHGLSPTSVKYRGLGGALQLLSETVQLNHRTPCSCEVDESILVSDTEKQAHLFRIAQEAVNNALRHGEPENVSIRLSRVQGATCELIVEDDGRGFAKPKKTGKGKKKSKQPDAPKAGIGLRVMEYRANMIGASLHAGARAGGGVIVTCRFQSDSAPHEDGDGGGV